MPPLTEKTYPQSFHKTSNLGKNRPLTGTPLKVLSIRLHGKSHQKGSMCPKFNYFVSKNDQNIYSTVVSFNKLDRSSLGCPAPQIRVVDQQGVGGHLAGCCR